MFPNTVSFADVSAGPPRIGVDLVTNVIRALT